jgi:replication-associated recombination protein RarA
MVTANVLEFCPQSAPQSLVEKYRPANLADFAGLSKPKELMRRLAEKPFSSAWIFVGPSGTGKTSMALALAEAIPADLQHIGSQECNVARVEQVWSNCFYHPSAGKRFWLNLVDEADQMSTAAQNSLLSKLDSTTPAPETVWVFTCNDTSRFEPRFLSRCRVVEFSNYGIQKDAVDLLTQIWNGETGGKCSPNLARIVKEANGNIRAALMSLEMELMLA